MTIMGINWLNYQESVRSHKVNESIGLGQLTESIRTNIANENIRRGTLDESIRHNVVSENVSWAQVAENIRTNKSNEAIRNRQITVNEATTRYNIDMKALTELDPFLAAMNTPQMQNNTAMAVLAGTWHSVEQGTSTMESLSRSMKNLGIKIPNIG